MPSSGGRHAARRRAARHARAERTRRRSPRRVRRARSATRVCPGAATSPWFRCASGAPATRASAEALTAPMRRIVSGSDGGVDDRRLDADAARTAIEHDVDVVAEVGAHVRGGRRAHPPETVGRRRGNRAANASSNASATGCVRNAEADRRRDHRSRPRTMRSDRLRNTSVSGPGQNAARQRVGNFGYVGGVLVERGRGRDVHDHRMVGGSTLHAVEAAQRLVVRRRRRPARTRSRSGTRPVPPARSTRTASSMFAAVSATTSS